MDIDLDTIDKEKFLIEDSTEMAWPDGKHGGCRVVSLAQDNLGGPWLCMGMHCAFCDRPCSSQGHFNCPERIKVEAGRAA